MPKKKKAPILDELPIFFTDGNQRDFIKFIFEKMHIGINHIEKNINNLKKLLDKKDITAGEVAPIGTPLLIFSDILSAIRFSPFLLKLLYCLWELYMGAYENFAKSLVAIEQELSKIEKEEIAISKEQKKKDGASLKIRLLEQREKLFEGLTAIKHAIRQSMLIDIDRDGLFKMLMPIEKRLCA
jgi:hypothetical protein